LLSGDVADWSADAEAAGPSCGSSQYQTSNRVCLDSKRLLVPDPSCCPPQEAICEQGMKDSSISTITSATTPDNAAANHIFNTLGFYHSHTVDVWPAFPALREYEAKVGFVPGQSPPDRPGQLSMLDFIPGEHNSLHKANTNT
jgi:hypothetical protein